MFHSYVSLPEGKQLEGYHNLYTQAGSSCRSWNVHFYVFCWQFNNGDATRQPRFFRMQTRVIQEPHWKFNKSRDSTGQIMSGLTQNVFKWKTYYGA